jgi:predicted transcriptional regulator YdeE
MKNLDIEKIENAYKIQDIQEDTEIVIIDKDIEVFCITADSFPDGILDVHQRLHAMIPFTIDRRYFGISRPEKGVIVYKAAAEKLEKDEAEKLNCESFTIEKGKYICLTILNYVEDLQSISKAFDRLISRSDIDPNGYCVEWYYTDKDVKCMIRLV